MIKVVIADDEVHICRLIQALIDWDMLGLKLVGVAGNGLEALALLRREHPDILITDIRMPGCDGLELVEKARAICEELQIVVISGYANFEYAQSALRFGVREYLLKPINREELADTMRKLKRRVEEQRHIVAQHEMNQENRQRDESRLRQLLVERLLDTQTPVIDSEMMEEQYHFSTKPGFFLGFALRADAVLQENGEEMLHLYGDRMIRIFTCGLEHCCFSWSFYRHHFSVYGILNFAKGRAQNVKFVLRDCLNQMNAQRNLFGSVAFTLGVGSWETEPEYLARSLQRAKLAVKERLLTDGGIVIPYEERQPVLYEKQLLPHYEKEIAHALEVMSQEELAVANQHLQEAVMETDGLQGYELYDIVTEAGNMFALQMNKSNKAELVKQFIRECDQCAHAEQLFAKLQSFTQGLLDERITRCKEDSARPVRLAKQYIQNHFSEPLSLEEVSERVGLSPAYFSVLFKKEVQTGFAKYLMNMRMEQAKILLRETNLPVAQICKKVGYNDLKHFTQNFEKQAGVKPAVFRKLYG